MPVATPKKDIVLPYGTTSDNIVKLLDAIKNKQGDSKAIKAVYSGSKFDSTQAALETLKIISGLELTDLGKSIVFESDPEKKKVGFLNAVLSYAPYEYFLLFILQDEPSTETEVDVLKNYWGKNNYGTANNRSEAAPVCFSLLQLAGLGEYVIGRKGKSTRFIWKEGYGDLIKNFQACPPTSPPSTSSDDMPSNLQTESECEDIPNESTTPNNQSFTHSVPATTVTIPSSIEIKVDMTEWDLDKIERFFALIKNQGDKCV